MRETHAVVANWLQGAAAWRSPLLEPQQDLCGRVGPLLLAGLDALVLEQGLSLGELDFQHSKEQIELKDEI